MTAPDPVRDAADAMVPVPARAQFPIEVTPPDGFNPDDLATWPDEPGRFEYVEGKLLYMPPCGFVQQVVTVDVVGVLHGWGLRHPEFFIGGNEAGMALGKDKRGADAVVWRRADIDTATWGFLRVPPVLAVEVAGRYDTEALLVEKARWYLSHGVAIVWVVLPETREVIVMRAERRLAQQARYRVGDSLPAMPELPDLQPAVSDFFRQIESL